MTAIRRIVGTSIVTYIKLWVATGRTRGDGGVVGEKHVPRQMRSLNETGNGVTTQNATLFPSDLLSAALFVMVIMTVTVALQPATFLSAS